MTTKETALIALLRAHPALVSTMGIIVPSASAAIRSAPRAGSVRTACGACQLRTLRANLQWHNYWEKTGITSSYTPEKRV